ncbi:hypothetical protein ACTQ1O_10705 [Bilifractor sp. LCP21S3_A7]|jgi:hypothetical protein|uniref:hypothetical protein n=1 Tax=Bilifractor sp. LCP21S3_A7 TaxID=3438738 RepID=UPI003F8E923F
MARRSRYLHYDEQVAALMKHSNPSQIPAKRNYTQGSVLEKLKVLRVAEPRKKAEKTVPEGGGDE